MTPFSLGIIQTSGRAHARATPETPPSSAVARSNPSLPRRVSFLVGLVLASLFACSSSIVEEDDGTLMSSTEMLGQLVESEWFQEDAAAFLMTESTSALIAKPETRAMLREEVHHHASDPDVELPIFSGATRLTLQVVVTGADRAVRAHGMALSGALR